MTDLRARTDSPEATRALAGALAGVARPGDLVLLVGDLGAGKTTFAQGFAAGLGVGDTVTSPTFTLVRPHPCRHPTIRTLHHADLYRLDHLRDVVELGLGELVEEEAVALVEWGDMAGPVLAPGALRVSLAPGPGGDEERALTVTAEGPAWEDRLGALAGALRPWAGGEG